MIKKIRPLTSIKLDLGNDGRDSRYYIEYRCPTCERIIGSEYGLSNACDRCGTFYDWGTAKPKIEIARTVRW